MSCSETASDSRKRSATDTVARFVNTMTFAQQTTVFDRMCACDECAQLPVPIANAVKRYKQMQHLTTTANLWRRTQDRQLVRRDNKSQVSIYKWTLPRNAEPLLEYGNSHRLIQIQRLPQHANIMSIGPGIVGSKHEEEQRFETNWSSDNTYLVPANGGKTVGWIHTAAVAAVEHDASVHSSGPVVLFMIKVPAELLDTALSDDTPQWVQSTWEICRNALNQDDRTAPLCPVDAATLKEMLDQIE